MPLKAPSPRRPGSQISVFLICANRLVGTPEVAAAHFLRFMLLKPPSPREVGRRAILRRVGRSVVLFGAVFRAKQCPRRKPRKRIRPEQKQNPRSTLPHPASRGAPSAREPFKKINQANNHRLRLGGRSDGRALNRYLSFPVIVYKRQITLRWPVYAPALLCRVIHC